LSEAGISILMSGGQVRVEGGATEGATLNRSASEVTVSIKRSSLFVKSAKWGKSFVVLDLGMMLLQPFLEQSGVITSLHAVERAHCFKK
jgi:hypothetical protein